MAFGIILLSRSPTLLLSLDHRTASWSPLVGAPTCSKISWSYFCLDLKAGRQEAASVGWASCLAPPRKSSGGCGHIRPLPPDTEGVKKNYSFSGSGSLPGFPAPLSSNAPLAHYLSQTQGWVQGASPPVLGKGRSS